jgi:hypothetical protein
MSGGERSAGAKGEKWAVEPLKKKKELTYSMEQSPS